MKIKHIAFGLALSASAIPMAASAVTYTGSTTPPQSLSISATVASACAFSTIPAISGVSYDPNWNTPFSQTFGAYTPDASGNALSGLSVSCTMSTPYFLTANQGANYGLATGHSTDNALVSTGQYLAYTLQVKGSTTFDPRANTSGVLEAETASAGTDQFGLVLGIPMNQHVPAAAYTDTVNFTVNY
jgi:spore coat protein U-like protein